MYEIEEIDITGGLPRSVVANAKVSGRKPVLSIPIAKLLKGVEKSYESGNKLLDDEYLDAVEAGYDANSTYQL